MNNLPLDLLEMIADSIQLETPELLERQSALAALARTNKTFYSICNPRIYRSPVLTSHESVVKWGRFYASKVNPWSICAGTKSLEKFPVPEKITFPRDTFLEGYSSEKKSLIDASLAVKTRFSPFFFRNLTSFDLSGYFYLDHRLIEAILGPLGSNRAKIIQISLHYLPEWMLVSYLLEAFNRFRWFANSDTYRAILDDPPAGDRDLDFLESLKERCTYEGLNFNAEEEDKLGEIAERSAPLSYSIFGTMTIDSFRSSVVLPHILQSREVGCHPFDSLQKLTFAFSYNFEFYLIFHSRLFPSLRFLKPIGEAFITDLIDYDIKLFRYAITELEGTVTPPKYVEERVEDTLQSPSIWAPLKADEIRNEPRIDYFGPNLSHLDLEDLTFVDDE